MTVAQLLARHRPSLRGIREAMRDQMQPRFVAQLAAMYETQTVPRRGGKHRPGKHRPTTPTN